MKEIAERELIRKLIHLATIVIPLSYKYIFNYRKEEILVLGGFLLLFALLVEYLRHRVKWVSQNFYNIFGSLLREEENRRITGATDLLISGLLSISMFPGEIAFLTMIFLIAGDAAASVVGKSVGKRFWRGSTKSLEGSIAIFVISFLVAIFATNLLPYALVGALLATLAELSAIPLNDNLKIPLISGIGLYLVQIF